MLGKRRNEREKMKRTAQEDHEATRQDAGVGRLEFRVRREMVGCGCSFAVVRRRLRRFTMAPLEEFGLCGLDCRKVFCGFLDESWLGACRCKATVKQYLVSRRQ
jgi:hypothetical protein